MGHCDCDIKNDCKMKNVVKNVKPIKYTPLVNSKKKVVKGQCRGVAKCLQGKKRNIVMKSGIKY